MPASFRGVARSRRIRIAMRSVAIGMLVLMIEEWGVAVRDSPSTKQTWLITTPKTENSAMAARSRGARGSRDRRVATTNAIRSAAADTMRIVAQARGGM